MMFLKIYLPFQKHFEVKFKLVYILKFTFYVVTKPVRHIPQCNNFLLIEKDDWYYIYYFMKYETEAMQQTAIYLNCNAFKYVIGTSKFGMEFNINIIYNMYCIERLLQNI